MCCLHPLLVNFEKETTKSNMSERVGRNQIRISTNCSIEHVVFQEDGRGHSKSRSTSQKPFHPVPRCFHTHTHTHPQSFTSQKSHHSHHKDLCSQNRMISKRSLSHCWALAPVQLLSQRPYLSQSANVTLRCVKITY